MTRGGTRDDAGKLLLRTTVAGLLLFHGVSKLTHGVGRISDRVATHGLPRFIGFGVLIGEVVAPLLVLAGWATRPAAAVIAINMLVAVWLVHVGDVLHMGSTGGWALELQAFYLFGALAVALLGPGRYAVSRGVGRWD